MPSMSSLRAVCALGFLWQSSCLEDVQALVQKSADLQSRTEGETTWPDLSAMSVICTDEDWDTLKKKTEAYHERLQKKADRVTARDSIRAKRAAQKAAELAAQARDAFVTPHTQWIPSYLNRSTDILETTFRPLITRFVKALLQVVDDKPPHWKNISLTTAIEGFELAIPSLRSSLVAALHEGLNAFDESLNNTVPTLPHQVRRLEKFHKAMPSLEDPFENWTSYVLDKMLPVLTLESYPQMAQFVKIIENMPDPDSPNFKSYLMNQVITAVMQVVMTPPAAASASTPLMKKAPEAPKPTAPPAEQIEFVPPPPVRQCLTCMEHYQQMVTDGSNQNSCVGRCFAAVPLCVGGINDMCLRMAAPCARCHKDKLKRLGGCEKVETYDKQVASLTKLTSILDEGADGFVEKIAQYLGE